MILDGALDQGTEASLGARLGVSPRHLRRLFISHLGVTPDGLARSARVHFARRLLDDTDLSVLEIAFAAGFGSVRQFNRACRDVFRASPRELRARRRKSDRLAADGGLPLRLPFDGELDWPAMVSYLGARAIPGVEHVAGDRYRRTIVVRGNPGVLELFLDEDRELVVLLHLPHWEELIHVVERARGIPGLDLDLEDARRVLRSDPTIGPMVRARPGLRVPGTWDPFETAVRAILGQQVTIQAANTLSGRLVERLGTPVGGLAQLGLTHLFPDPDMLAEADMRDIGVPRARADAVRLFARAVVDGQVRLDRSVDLDRFVESITAIDGLGPWTAHYVALRAGERDAFPATDLGLRAALERHGNRTADIAERWRPWRALAATHIWLAGSRDAAESAPVASTEATAGRTVSGRR